MAALCALGRLAPAHAQTLPSRHLVLATYEDAVPEADIGVRIMTEAYRRLGITIEVRRFAAELATQRSSSGAVDGEVLRLDGLDQRYPDLVQVPVPVSLLEVAVYSRDSTRHVTAWQDLTGLNVAAVRGVTAVERAIGDLHVRQVDTYAELYPLLVRGEVDAIIAPVLQTRLTLGTTRGVYRNGLLGTYLLYHYLHRKNAALVAQVEPVLKTMLLDGTIARIQAAQLAALAAGRPARAP